MWRNILLVIFLTLFISFLLFVFLSSPILGPLATNIYYTFGFPFLLAALLAISMTSFSAGLANQLALLENNAPGLIKLLIKFLSIFVDPRPLPPAVWLSAGFISFFVAFFSLTGLIPRCLTSRQVSPHLQINNAATVDADLFSGQALAVDPGTRVHVKTVIETGGSRVPAPMACEWRLVVDRRYQTLSGCSPSFLAGVDSEVDVLTLTLQQSYCASLGDVHFYFQPSQ